MWEEKVNALIKIYKEQKELVKRKDEERNVCNINSMKKSREKASA